MIFRGLLFFYLKIAKICKIVFANYKYILYTELSNLI